MKNGMHPLIIGNWKMNPLSLSQAVKLAKELKTRLSKFRAVDVVIAPPALYLENINRVRNGSRAFKLGVQNIHQEKLGAHTGEISLPMVESVGVTHVILGHSERRAAGETNAQIQAKITATLKASLTAILCVGEKKRDEAAHYLTVIENQIRKGLANVPKSKLDNLVVAYEPVWAIGTGATPTAGDVHEMRLFIEKVLSDMYSRNYARRVRIIYGGSVNDKNATELFSGGNIDGFLPGGASLHPDVFARIVKQVQEISNV